MTRLRKKSHAYFLRRQILTRAAIWFSPSVRHGNGRSWQVRVSEDGEDGLPKELAAARADLASAALTTRDGEVWPDADQWRYRFETTCKAALSIGSPSLDQYGLAAIRRKREVLEDLRLQRHIGDDAFIILQEELDFDEISLSSGAERRIEEI